jgi:iron complex outermembrane receptor protein
MFMKRTACAVALVLLMPGWTSAVSAQGGGASVDLAGASLADLMKIEITSASRKEQRLFDTAAAVYVITAEDIRRSGLTSVPELLRLAPGVQVARINGSKWAVSVRGFNGLYSNKLLVLIDGRTVYNPIFAGVTWDSEDLMVENIDRIEIVRGPGGAVWGANAVNGVINVVTKKATATQGMFVRVGAGTLDSTSLALRYGGTAKSVAYRAYAQWSQRGGSDLAPGLSQKDDADGLTVGARADGTGTNTTWMVQLNAISARSHGLWAKPTLGRTLEPADVLTEMSHVSGGVLLARWTRQMASGRSLRVESSFDVSRRDEPVGDYGQRSAEAVVQYRTRIGARHDVIAGVGYRSMHVSLDGHEGIALVPGDITQGIFNTFGQDEIALVPDRLSLSLGAKVEHAAGIGVGIQPTGRLMWSVKRNQRVWMAVSRALRTASILDRHIFVQFPLMPTPTGIPLRAEVSGNTDTRSESVVSVESGYRAEVGDFALDVTAFTSRYGQLRTTEPQAPYLSMTSAGPVVVAPLTFANRMHADARGFEVSADWRPLPFWRLDAGYSAFHLSPHLDADSRDPGTPAHAGGAPGQQWQARSWIALPARIQVDMLLLHAGAMSAIEIPAYTRADLRVEFPLTRQLSLVAVGQNLIDASHIEFGGRAEQVIATRQPRAGRVQLVWKF